MLTAYLAQKLLNPEDVDDILQETISLALERGEQTDIRSPKSYLFIIARNLLSKQLKAQARDMECEVEDLDLNQVPCKQASVERQIDSKKILEAFLANVRALPPQCRRVFLLRKLFGWSHKRIAAHFGISTSTVERHITIALTRLDNIRGSYIECSTDSKPAVTPFYSNIK